MNIFQVVKENVTARQAAEQYNLKISVKTGWSVAHFMMIGIQYESRQRILLLCLWCERGCDHICDGFLSSCTIRSSKGT